MSDFLYASVPQPAGRLRALLERRLRPLDTAYEERHGSWGSVAVARLPFDPPIVSDDGQSVRLTLGREGGPSASLLLDTTAGQGSVRTDRMAFVPLFWSDGGDAGLVIGSHVDAVAEAAGRLDAFDAVSAADCVAHGSIVFPHTMYAQVWQLAPATERRFRVPHGWDDTGREYWTPVERCPFASLDDAAAALRAAFVAEVEKGLQGVGSAGMLLSAGEDSRAVLGAVPRDIRVDAVTFADWESREVEIARRIAHAYGASFRVGIREFAHYLDGLEPIASFVGSQHQYIDVHAWRLHRELALDRMPVVLGGFSSDVLLKGYYSPARARRSQPQKRHPGEHDPLRVAPVPGVRRELIDAALERRERRRTELRTIRPESATEWMRIWPFGVRKPAAAFVGHRRLFAAFEPFMTDSIVELAASVPMEWKLDRRLFSQAMKPLLRPSRFIPHGRNTFPYFGRYASLGLGAGLALGRFAHDALRGRLGRHQGPWPDWERLVESERFAELLRRHPIADARAAAIFEADSAGAIERVVRERWSPKRQLMLVQLAYATGVHATTTTEIE